ncbi:MAG: hypothetical protein Q8P41_24210 [Pseudomonadota bacterium]|nr:hypothetical protein [Pseudomonadota bacterium]
MQRLLQLVGGTALGLVLAEGMFWVADDGAFAHVNFYVPDAALGVRLAPGATERISFGGNPVTSIRVNDAGYRGAEWGPPQDGEVVVLGDSQVFGLGVEEDQTASAVLAAALGRPVRNAGVPTYGPGEYLAVLDETLAARRPKTVVLVLNFSNDIFEKDTPNTQRHAVWDGWAVRLETAPDAVFEFPGRRWLMSQSHLVLAARRAWWTPPEAWEQGVASEGTWARMMAVATGPEPAAADEQGAGQADEVLLAADVDRAASERLELEYELVELYRRAIRQDDGIGAHGTDVTDLGVEAAIRHAHPGDIVEQGYAESSRSITVTAAQLREGAKLRAGLESALVKWAADNKQDDRAKDIRAALASRATLDTELSALATRVAEEVSGRSPLLDVVAAAKARCDAAGAELVVVALPLDVQVSDTEWAKYGVAEKLDMAPTRVLLADLVTNARRLGVRALDATEALAAAEPGAFLLADLHMSAKGQAALGEALATVVRAPPPPAMPGPGLPVGRTRVPTWSELELGKEVVVRGSTKNHCSTRTLREWLLVECDEAPAGAEPLGVLPIRGAEVLTGGGGRTASLVAPLLPGREIVADFVWSDRTERLTVAWEGDKPRMAFAPTAAAEAPVEPRCRAAPQPWKLRDRFDDFTRGCEASFPDACDAQLACAAGTRAPIPTCPDGQANAGSAGFCYPLCDDANPCAADTCTPWQGGHVCM